MGWAIGIERVLELLKEQGALDVAPAVDAYAIVPDAASLPAVMACLQTLRAAGTSVLMHASGPEGMASMKSQFKRADASGARYALVFGADEMAQGQVTVKALRDANVAQQTLALPEAAQWAVSLQSNA